MGFITKSYFSILIFHQLTNFNEKVNFEQEWMLKNFQKNQDREQIWIHKIDLKVKK